MWCIYRVSHHVGKQVKQYLHSSYGETSSAREFYWRALIEPHHLVAVPADERLTVLVMQLEDSQAGRFEIGFELARRFW